MLQREKIKILGLLTQRDKEFVRLWDCEEKIREILGGLDFPFPRVVELPSEKRSAQRKRPELDFSWVDNYHTTIRDLRPPQENAYRVEYLNGKKTRISYHIDKALVESLIDISCECFGIISVTAGFFKSNGDWKPTETVWSSTE